MDIQSLTSWKWLLESMIFDYRVLPMILSWKRAAKKSIENQLLGLVKLQGYE
ncbi:MAG: hypothetical protein ACTSVI_12150 [Promethearchaeota archaeon]